MREMAGMSGVGNRINRAMLFHPPSDFIDDNSWPKLSLLPFFVFLVLKGLDVVSSLICYAENKGSRSQSVRY